MAGAVTSTSSSASRRAESKSRRAWNLARTSDDTSSPGHRSSFMRYETFLSRRCFFFPQQVIHEKKSQSGILERQKPVELSRLLGQFVICTSVAQAKPFTHHLL